MIDVTFDLEQVAELVHAAYINIFENVVDRWPDGVRDYPGMMVLRFARAQLGEALTMLGRDVK